MGVATFVMVFKVGYISKVNRWSKLIFCMLTQIQRTKGYFNNFRVGVVKHGMATLLRLQHCKISCQE